MQCIAGIQILLEPKDAAYISKSNNNYYTMALKNRNSRTMAQLVFFILYYQKLIDTCMMPLFRQIVWVLIILEGAKL